MTTVRTAKTIFGALLLLTHIPFGTAHADTPIGGGAVYTDSLQNGWQNWSWAKGVHLDSTGPVHTGTSAVSVMAGPFEAVSFHHDPLDTAPYTALSFWLREASPATQTLKVQALLADKPQTDYPLPGPAPNVWRHYVVPLKSLGAEAKATLTGFWIQEAGGKTADFALDDIALVATTQGDGQTDVGVPPPPAALNPPVTVEINVAVARHPISPGIYGVNFAGPEHAAMGTTFNRFGGDNETGYNWKQNAHTTGNDWFYETVPLGDATPGGAVDQFIAGSKTIGALPMVTIPTIGWVGKLGPNREKLASYSVAKYGPQAKTDAQWMPDAGNGLKPDGKTPLPGTDPNDANTPADPAFMREWVAHLVSRWGTASQGGVRYYLMDNEPNLWQLGHRDVHPQGATMEEIRDRVVAYATQVRAADPSAKIVAPEAWDWNGVRLSGADIQHGGTSGDWKVGDMPDRKAHGGEDFLPWFLDQMRAYEKRTGTRLLDVCSFHYYPQDELNDDVSPAVQLRRNRSTRSLWDPTYKAESWVNDYVDMLPRVKAWVAGHYPGTKIALTEYNWGADAFIGGATAQADVLGILGRAGLDIATRFSAPKPDTPVFNAFRMYRNYDGHFATFGDTSVQAVAPNPDNVAAFAAVRSGDKALTVMVISKVLSGSTPVTLRLTNAIVKGPVQVWQLTSTNHIDRLADVPLKSGAVTATLPAQSISLFIVPLAHK